MAKMNKTLKEILDGADATEDEILDKILEVKDYINKLRETEKQLQQKLFEKVQKPIDGKPVWIGDLAKVVWRTDAKISQKVAKIWLDRNPELAKRIFSMSLKPKISEISRIDRTIISNPDKVPEWAEDFEKIKQDITFEEKQILEIVKQDEIEEE